MKMLFTAVLCAWASVAAAADPFGWRGNGTGSFADAQPPTSWTTDTNVLWKVALPNGYNSPVYSDGRVFVTAEPALVLCFDARNGKELWRGTVDYEAALGADKAKDISATHQRFEAEKRAAREPFEKLRKEDPKAQEPEELKTKIAEIDKQQEAFEKRFPSGQRGGTGNVAATPVTDGERVYVTFATGIVAAFTTSGDREWIRHVEAPPANFGHSASPALADGKLIVHFQNMLALDPATGKEVWRASVPAKHGSPVVSVIDDEPIIVSPAGSIVKASDGAVLADKLFDLSDNSPLVHDGVIYAHQSGSALALRLPDKIEQPLAVEKLWETKVKGDQRMTSATYHDGLLYAGTRRGILDVIDAESGKMLDQKRLQVGELFPSVTVAGGLVFMTGTEGKTVVLQPGSQYQEVSTGELEKLSSSPIFVGKRVFVRTDKTLYCIGEGETTFVSEK
jgi:outer membrane protein assembly factor BamB